MAEREVGEVLMNAWRLGSIWVDKEGKWEK